MAESWMMKSQNVSTFLHSLILEMNRHYEKGNDIVFIIYLYPIDNNID